MEVVSDGADESSIPKQSSQRSLSLGQIFSIGDSGRNLNVNEEEREDWKWEKYRRSTATASTKDTATSSVDNMGGYVQVEKVKAMSTSSGGEEINKDNVIKKETSSIKTATSDKNETSPDNDTPSIRWSDDYVAQAKPTHSAGNTENEDEVPTIMLGRGAPEIRILTNLDPTSELSKYTPPGETRGRDRIRGGDRRLRRRSYSSSDVDDLLRATLRGSLRGLQEVNNIAIDQKGETIAVKSDEDSSTSTELDGVEDENEEWKQSRRPSTNMSICSSIPEMDMIGGEGCDVNNMPWIKTRVFKKGQEEVTSQSSVDSRASITSRRSWCGKTSSWKQRMAKGFQPTEEQAARLRKEAILVHLANIFPSSENIVHERDRAHRDRRGSNHSKSYSSSDLQLLLSEYEDREAKEKVKIHYTLVTVEMEAEERYQRYQKSSSMPEDMPSRLASKRSKKPIAPLVVGSQSSHCSHNSQSSHHSSHVNSSNASTKESIEERFKRVQSRAKQYKRSVLTQDADDLEGGDHQNSERFVNSRRDKRVSFINADALLPPPLDIEYTSIDETHSTASAIRAQRVDIEEGRSPDIPVANAEYTHLKLSRSRYGLSLSIDTEPKRHEEEEDRSTHTLWCMSAVFCVSVFLLGCGLVLGFLFTGKFDKNSSSTSSVEGIAILGRTSTPTVVMSTTAYPSLMPSTSVHDSTISTGESSSPTLSPTKKPSTLVPSSSSPTDQSTVSSTASSLVSKESCYPVEIKILFDSYPFGTGYVLSSVNQPLESVSYFPLDNSLASQEYIETLCLNDGSYKFVMYDSYGDGICCGTNGNGEYIVTSNGITLAQGGDFTYSDETLFELSN